MKNLKKRNDFLSIKENINNNILEELANEISSAETEDGFVNTEDSTGIIKGFLNDLEKESQIEDVKVILNSYSQNDWENWLTDIIYHGIGYPINSLSPIGDVILDMTDYLRANLISSSNYELAISSYISKTYFENPENTVLLERLLNTYIALTGFSANEIIIQILTLPNYTFRKGQNNFIKTLALLALSKSSKLTSEKQEVDYKKDIINYIALKGIDEMRHDPYFYSTALRFSYLQISSKFFFVFLSLLLSKLESFEDNNLKKTIKYLLISKIEELYYEKLPTFFSDLLDWIITSSNPSGRYFKIASNNMALEFVCDIASLIKSGELGLLELKDKEMVFDNEPSSDRMFFNADLQILWNDGTMEEDVSLKKEEIDFIIKQLNKYN